jgi:hypothetical protein
MAGDKRHLNRRDILKVFGIGAMGSPHVKKDQLFRTETQTAKVSLFEQCRYHFKPHNRMVEPYNLS